MLRQGPLAAETGKDPERADAFRDAAAQGQVAFVQSQHLGALDQPRVASCTGCPDGVVRTCDAHIQSHFARRVVRHRAGIVVMRPETGVVIVPLDLEDLVLRLDVPVLGNPQIDPDPRFVHVLPVQPGILDRLVAAIDPDTARPRASPQVSPRLMAAFVKAADPGKRFTHIADLVFRYPAATVQ